MQHSGVEVPMREANMQCTNTRITLHATEARTVLSRGIVRRLRRARSWDRTQWTTGWLIGLTLLLVGAGQGNSS